MRQAFARCGLFGLLGACAPGGPTPIAFDFEVHPEVLPPLNWAAADVRAARTVQVSENPAWSVSVPGRVDGEDSVLLAGITGEGTCRVTARSSDVAPFTGGAESCAVTESTRTDDSCSLTGAAEAIDGLARHIFTAAASDWYAIRIAHSGPVEVSLICLPAADWPLRAAWFQGDDVSSETSLSIPPVVEGSIVWTGTGVLEVARGKLTTGAYLAVLDYVPRVDPPSGSRLYGRWDWTRDAPGGPTEPLIVTPSALLLDLDLDEVEPNDVVFDAASAILDVDSLDQAQPAGTLGMSAFVNRVAGSVLFHSDVAEYDHDVDVFAVDIPQDAQGVVTVAWSDLDADLDLILFRDDGVRVAYGEGGSQTRSIYLATTPLDAGRYYLAVLGYSGRSGSSAPYEALLYLDSAAPPPG